MFLTRALLAITAALCIVLPAIVVPASASAATAVPIAAEIEARDQLISDQEALLNVYRCMFAVDVAAVPGGCANGVPAQPAGEPGPPPPNPSKADKDARDNLIAAQENLLNAYRCNHNIDTQLVPGGCPEPVDDTSEAEEDEEVVEKPPPIPPPEEEFVFDSEGNLCTTDWGLRPDGLCYTDTERDGQCTDHIGYLPPGFTASDIILDLETFHCILYGYVYEFDVYGNVCQSTWGVRPDGQCYSQIEIGGYCTDAPTNLILEHRTGVCFLYED